MTTMIPTLDDTRDLSLTTIAQMRAAITLPLLPTIGPVRETRDATGRRKTTILLRSRWGLHCSEALREVGPPNSSYIQRGADDRH
jgi:hypothetical protein